jgi:serine/threonine-protein kinase
LGTLHHEDQPQATGGAEPDPLETAHKGGDPKQAAWPPETPTLGDGQDFEIQGVIARGGSATLYRAWDRRVHRAVAIKVIRAELQSSRWIIENEAKFLGQLLHPHIAPVLSAGRTSSGSAYLTMPLYDEDLAQLIRQGNQPLDRLLRHFAAICDALDYVHRRGVIHGDPKPSNIVTKGDHAALIDWGLAMHRAHFAAADPIVDWHGVRLGDGQIYGTPVYMSPEQLRGDPDVTPATDVYVLGGTLYTILTGQAPYSSVGNMSEFLRSRLKGDVKPQPVRELQSSVPKELARICDRALASSPNDRFPSAAAVGAAIHRWLNRGWWRKSVRRLFWTTGGKGP